MAANFLMAISNALRCHWRLLPRDQLAKFHHWFRKWLGTDQATSHFLNQWWLIYRCIYESLDLNELTHNGSLFIWLFTVMYLYVKFSHLASKSVSMEISHGKESVCLWQNKHDLAEKTKAWMAVNIALWHFVTRNSSNMRWDNTVHPFLSHTQYYYYCSDHNPYHYFPYRDINSFTYTECEGSHRIRHHGIDLVFLIIPVSVPEGWNQISHENIPTM